MNSATPKFTICIPTYNRGPKALKLVQTVLHDIDEDWELLVLNNASTSGDSEYSEIERLARRHENLRYIRHSSNGMFHGNYLACFTHAAAPFFMIVSDEDFPNPQMIRSIAPILSESPNISVYRGSIAPCPGVEPRNSFTLGNFRFTAGEQALMRFGFSNNYISGTIYNRILAEQAGLIDYLRDKAEQQRVYPHLYMDLLMAASGDVVTCSEIACFEGHEQITNGDDMVLGVCNGPMFYNPPYSFGSRIDQFIALRSAIRDAVTVMSDNFNFDLFIKLYFRLCERYLFLISKVNGPMYRKYKMNMPLLRESFLYVCAGSAFECPELLGADTKIYEEIFNIFARFESNQ
jgi:glycosyltransferase involved in cell wall biosynthesis